MITMKKKTQKNLYLEYLKEWVGIFQMGILRVDVILIPFLKLEYSPLKLDIFQRIS